MNGTTDDESRPEATRAGASAYGTREPEDWTIEDETEAGPLAGEPGRDSPPAEPGAGEEPGERESEQESRRKAEEFAAQHDPDKHDIAAGEEFRQDGDWTAEHTGGPQVWDAEGTLVEGGGEPEPDQARDQG